MSTNDKYDDIANQIGAEVEKIANAKEKDLYAKPKKDFSASSSAMRIDDIDAFINDCKASIGEIVEPKQQAHVVCETNAPKRQEQRRSNNKSGSSKKKSGNSAKKKSSTQKQTSTRQTRQSTEQTQQKIKSQPTTQKASAVNSKTAKQPTTQQPQVENISKMPELTRTKTAEEIRRAAIEEQRAIRRERREKAKNIQPEPKQDSIDTEISDRELNIAALIAAGFVLLITGLIIGIVSLLEKCGVIPSFDELTERFIFWMIGAIYKLVNWFMDLIFLLCDKFIGLR